MKLVYIAGPYRAETTKEVAINISNAKLVRALATHRGWFPVIPHANTGHMEESVSRPDQFWLNGTMEMMRRCDAVLLCPGWATSSGTKAEIREAQALGIPIYEHYTELPPITCSM